MKNLETHNNHTIEKSIYPTTSNINNKNTTKFKLPMGATGNLIAVCPVILSEFETNVYCELRYKAPINNIESHSNKIILKRCLFKDHNKKLLIEGFVEKLITITFVDNSQTKNTLVTIPFRTIIELKYSYPPQVDSEYKLRFPNCKIKETYYSPAEKLYWSHEYTKLKETFEDVPSCNEQKEYVNNLVITLGLSILQTQKIFIPEPSCEATVIGELFHSDTLDNQGQIKRIEVGATHTNTLLARIIKD
ncbi:MAG: hypothetical protein ACRCYE_11770 [Sarcina sp.]